MICSGTEGTVQWRRFTEKQQFIHAEPLITRGLSSKDRVSYDTQMRKKELLKNACMPAHIHTKPTSKQKPNKNYDQKKITHNTAAFKT